MAPNEKHRYVCGGRWEREGKIWSGICGNQREDENNYECNERDEKKGIFHDKIKTSFVDTFNC